MNNCPDLFFLSALACVLSDMLTSDELTLLDANLSALGDMLTVLLTQNRT